MSPALQVDSLPAELPGKPSDACEGKASRSGILTWRIPMDRGAWQATVQGGRKELDTTEQLSIARHSTGSTKRFEPKTQSSPETSSKKSCSEHSGRRTQATGMWTLCDGVTGEALATIWPSCH